MVSQSPICYLPAISFARATVEGLKDDFVRSAGYEDDRAHEPAVNGKELSDDACTRAVENAMKSNWIRPLERE